MTMIGEMDADSIVGYFRGKSILITGATGFLGNVLVEKILRIQTDVKKLFLLIRVSDLESAKHRVHNEVIGREIFQVLKEKHGIGFDDFINEKICPLVGDVMYENFGLDTAVLKELSTEIDIIVNGAATTNFFERYDVAFDTNVLGAKHICAIASYFNGETRRELKAYCSTEKAERKTMKDLGLKRAHHFGWPNTYVFTKAMGEMLLGHLRGDYPVVIIRPSIITSTFKDPVGMEGIRTIDSVIIGYAKQTISFFLVDLHLTTDLIPGDMVVNAMMVAMAAHSEDERAQIIYHVTSSLCNPAPWAILADSMHRYFSGNPPSMGRKSERVRLKKMQFFSMVAQLKLYTAIKYKIPLEMLRLVNFILCGVFSRQYDNLSKKYRFFMQLIELYAPYTLFKGCFDDMNLERLKTAMNMEENINGVNFDFDSKPIDWADYFYNVHIPGLLKYMHD